MKTENAFSTRPTKLRKGIETESIEMQCDTAFECQTKKNSEIKWRSNHVSSRTLEQEETHADPDRNSFLSSLRRWIDKTTDRVGMQKPWISNRGGGEDTWKREKIEKCRCLFPFIFIFRSLWRIQVETQVAIEPEERKKEPTKQTCNDEQRT